MLCLRRYIFFALTYAAIVLWIIEGGTNSEQFPSAANTDQMKRSMFTMAQSFLSGGDHRLEPHTSAGRALLMSVSFTVLVLMTTYTANMTTTKSKVTESYCITAPLHHCTPPLSTTQCFVPLLTLSLSRSLALSLPRSLAPSLPRSLARLITMVRLYSHRAHGGAAVQRFGRRHCQASQDLWT